MNQGQDSFSISAPKLGTMTTQKYETTSRIRRRDGWIKVREVPRTNMDASVVSEEDSAGASYGSVSDAVLSTSKEIARQEWGEVEIENKELSESEELTDDDCRDEGVNDNGSRSGGPGEGDRLNAPEIDEQGFEVQMSMGVSGSATSDFSSCRTSDGSGLDFSLDRLSGGGSGRVESGDGVYKKEQSTSAVDSSGDHRELRVKVPTNDQSTTLTKPQHDLVDDTPRINNRTETTEPESRKSTPQLLRAYKLFLKQTKAAEITPKATSIVSEQHKSPPACVDRYGVDERSLKYFDSKDSHEVDRRWDMFRSKFGVKQVESESSDDFRELLDVNSGPCMSPKCDASQTSQKIEDFLIRDCLETGDPANEKSVAGKQMADTVHFTFSSQSPSVGDGGTGRESQHRLSDTNKAWKDTESMLPHNQQTHKKLVLPKPPDEDELTSSLKIEVSLASSVSSDGSYDEAISEASGANRPADQGRRSPKEESGCDKDDGPLKNTKVQGGLSWWRINGIRHVQDTLHASGSKAPSPGPSACATTPQNEGTISQQDKVSTNRKTARKQSMQGCVSSLNKVQAECCISDSKSDCSLAFQRGLSLFGKRKTLEFSSRIKSADKVPVQRRTQQLTAIPAPQPNNDDESAKQVVSTPNGHVPPSWSKITSSHAPQPKPDDDSSNKVSRWRRSRVDSESSKKVEENIPLEMSSESRLLGNIRIRQSRPGHEEILSEEIIGLGPSPRPRKRMDDLKVPTRCAPSEMVNPQSLVSFSASCVSDLSATHDQDIQKILLQSMSGNEPETKDAENLFTVSSSLTESSDEQESECKDFCPTPVAPEKQLETHHKVTMGVDQIRSFDASKGLASEGSTSWRLDPKESLSDFEIRVRRSKSNTTEGYNVHKHILGVGPRRSEFLQTVFHSKNTSSTEISIVDKAVDHIPDFLDYIYCFDRELSLSTENVMAFRYLSGIFQIRPVLVETATFIARDIQICNMSVYITESYRYNDHMVTKLIAAKCGENIESIALSDVLWTVMDPVLFLKVICCPNIERKLLSRRLSLLLVEYHSLHDYEMDEKLFHSGSLVSVIPLIDRKAALPMLEICEKYGFPESLQNLQKRCAHVAACNWSTTSDGDRKRLFSLMRSLPSSFTVDFMELVQSGKSTQIFDSAMLRMLKETGMSTDENYESADSFTPAKLCGYRLKEKDNDLNLTWRMNADDSFSDWDIVIQRNNDKEREDVYHVHKHMLAVGQFRSTFFAKLFLNADASIASSGSTTIQLAQGPAEQFPVLLDFLYKPNHFLDISTATAPSLRFLSRVLGIWMLNKEVIQFIEDDMSLLNLQFYLEQAELYDDERIVKLAISKCANRIRDINVDSVLLKHIKPDFFGAVLASEIDKTAACHINVLIARYFTLHDLSETLLAELMKHVPMQEVDEHEALTLLQVMGSVKNKNVSFFSDICKRCADILIKNWTEIRGTNREKAFQILGSMDDSSLVAYIFDAVEANYERDQHEAMSVQSKLVKRYRAQLADAESRLETAVALARQENEDLIAELMEKQKLLESELAGHKNATDRRAVRSGGGHQNASPSRPPPCGIHHESFIPTPKTRSTPERRTPQNDRLNYDDHLSKQKETAQSERNLQGSFFGRVFTCTPIMTCSEEERDHLSRDQVSGEDQQMNVTSRMS